MIRRLAEEPQPTSMAPFADCLDQGCCTLQEPAVRALLADKEGFAEEDGKVKIAGDLFRRLLIGLERELKGRATTLGFRDLIVDGPFDLSDLVFDRSLQFDKCEFRGPLRTGMLACRTLSIENSTLNSSFDGRVMSLRGNLFLRKTSAAGPVIIRDCSADGVIDCSGSSFNFSPAGAEDKAETGMPEAEHCREAFGASRIRARALFWRGITLGGTGKVTLYDADVGTLRDDMAEPDRGLSSWPRAGALQMRGFSYVRKNAAPYDTHLEWLKRDLKDFESNGRVLISCLEAASALDDATKLRIELRRHANQSEPERVRRWSRAVYLRLQQLAFHPGRVLLLLAGLYVLTGLLSAFLQEHDLIVPVDGSIIANGCFARLTQQCADNGWVAIEGHTYYLPQALRHFSAFSYALDLIFPYRPGSYTLLWGGANILVSLLLLGLRVLGLALQASLLWSLFGNRDTS